MLLFLISIFGVLIAIYCIIQTYRLVQFQERKYYREIKNITDSYIAKLIKDKEEWLEGYQRDMIDAKNDPNLQKNYNRYKKMVVGMYDKLIDKAASDPKYIKACKMFL